ncbi:hypothetical protein C1H46_000075 [Malus baccata]|uniref:Uncharacterized protein n=1 Tax=Malus baccata TaxID=106549 RepID=A0A540NSY6_MALBA|nr:hypothetical protein C1H46_000075 [Malus baccata]
MEGRKKTGSSSSSFTSELFGSKESSASSGIFWAIFASSSKDFVLFPCFFNYFSKNFDGVSYCFLRLFYWVLIFIYAFFVFACVFGKCLIWMDIVLLLLQMVPRKRVKGESKSITNMDIISSITLLILYVCMKQGEMYILYLFTRYILGSLYTKPSVLAPI